MNTPTPTPTPRTDAAWNATFDGEQMSAGRTARALRECSQQLETELATLTAERDAARAEVKSCGELSCDECNNRTAALVAERDQLRAQLHALNLVCGTTDADKFQTWVDRANARAERAEAELATERARLADLVADLSDACITLESAENDCDDYAMQNTAFKLMAVRNVFAAMKEDRA